MHCVAQSEAKGKSSTSLLPLLLGHGFPALNNKKCAVSYFFYNFPIQLLLLSLTLCAIGIALLLLVEDNRALWKASAGAKCFSVTKNNNRIQFNPLSLENSPSTRRTTTRGRRRSTEIETRSLFRNTYRAPLSPASFLWIPEAAAATYQKEGAAKARKRNKWHFCKMYFQSRFVNNWLILRQRPSTAPASQHRPRRQEHQEQ